MADTSLLVVKITFIVAEKTFTLAVVVSGQDPFCSGLDTFKVVVFTSVAEITFVVAEITF